MPLWNRGVAAAGQVLGEDKIEPADPDSLPQIKMLTACQRGRPMPIPLTARGPLRNGTLELPGRTQNCETSIMMQKWTPWPEGIPTGSGCDDNARER